VHDPEKSARQLALFAEASLAMVRPEWIQLHERNHDMDSTRTEKPRLGRGLDALLGGGDGASLDRPESTSEVPLSQIQQNPYQPRKHFDAEAITSLSASVREHGILQPLVVRQVNGQYQLIAGERRFRAAQEIGLATVPIRVVDFNDQQVIEAALVENIQRADLNPIEKAQGFKEYLDRFSLSHEQLAQRLGLARSSITNLVNLLDMAPEVVEGVRLNQISEAHAKLLKGIKSRDKQIAMFKQIVAMGLSVKAAEAMIRDAKEGAGAGGSSKSSGGGKSRESSGGEKTAHIRSVENDLRQKLAVPVEIRVQGKDNGEIVLAFASNDDFERLIEVLQK
jgi:ParB family chromosome partitioning protein